MSRVQEWRDDALCAEVDPEIFHPKQGESIGPAREVCMACPVRRECADHAIPNEPYGVWGGLSPRERQRLRRSLAPTAA
ncbi:WhiB family transcriptional regulator [Streptomyces niveus]|uniref:WhiB family transcriptional regulator n=1 Tax=Streptomyces niveus TaxID=193462 RepID=UPI00084BFBDB|nr:WhiB family transcriptional regulator [Streptomyces niveus]